MKNYTKIAIFVVVILVLGVLIDNGERGSQQLVGGPQTAPYKATTTDATWAQASKFKVLKTGTGTFGRVIITDATAGTLNFYDATTTGPHSNHATTTIGVIAASAAETTYDFEVGFTRGLIVEFPTGGAASSTITWE